jgi:hypothetical protein
MGIQCCNKCKKLRENKRFLEKLCEFNLEKGTHTTFLKLKKLP